MCTHRKDGTTHAAGHVHRAHSAHSHGLNRGLHVFLLSGSRRSRLLNLVAGVQATCACVRYNGLLSRCQETTAEGRSAEAAARHTIASRTKNRPRWTNITVGRDFGTPVWSFISSIDEISRRFRPSVDKQPFKSLSQPKSLSIGSVFLRATRSPRRASRIQDPARIPPTASTRENQPACPL